MNFLDWQKSRLVILRCCSFTILVALILLLTKNNKYSFPQEEISQKWELIKTEKINGEDLEGRKYQSGKKHNLVIEIYHIPNNKRGNLDIVNKYLEIESGLKSFTMLEGENIGHYGLFSEGNKTYLTTCIHSQGKIAFTYQQFAQLANYKLSDRLLPWIFGLSDLRDWSCLWVNMSMSLDNITPEEAAILLEKQLFDLISQMKFNR